MGDGSLSCGAFPKPQFLISRIPDFAFLAPRTVREERRDFCCCKPLRLWLFQQPQEITQLCGGEDLCLFKDLRGTHEQGDE